MPKELNSTTVFNLYSSYRIESNQKRTEWSQKGWIVVGLYDKLNSSSGLIFSTLAKINETLLKFEPALVIILWKNNIS